MNTSSPFSFISYNSVSFLEMKLKEMFNNHIISDYMFIYHRHEDDETKDHIHGWVNPNTRIDTINFQLQLQQPDPTRPDKPLGITNPRKSDMDDWILYTQHYKPYLISKMQDRKYYYQKDDFHFLDQDTFDENYYHAFHSSDWATQSQINKLLQDPDFCRADLIFNGVLPLQSANSLLSLLRLEQSNANGITDRHGRSDVHD